MLQAIGHKSFLIAATVNYPLLQAGEGVWPHRLCTKSTEEEERLHTMVTDCLLPGTLCLRL